MNETVTVISLAVALIALAAWPLMFYFGLRLGLKASWRMAGKEGDPLDEDDAPKIEQEDTQ